MRARRRGLLKRCMRGAFELGQHLGLNILPVHFYSAIPDMRELKRDDYWKRPRSMVQVKGADVESQLAFVRECCPDELVVVQKTCAIYETSRRQNGEDGFGRIEADFLHCFITRKRPTKIIQIGAGLSTAVMLRAAKDASYTPEVVCVDPHPNRFLQETAKREEIRLIPEKAQVLDVGLLSDLPEGGLLFIDSTHTVKPGSEVNQLMLEVLPRLPAGIWVHFHDIYFPYDYPRDLMSANLVFPNESVLLHAFLSGNARYTLKASLSMLHYARPADLTRFLPNYRPARNEHGLSASDGDAPSSAYLQTVSPGTHE